MYKMVYVDMYICHVFVYFNLFNDVLIFFLIIYMYMSEKPIKRISFIDIAINLHKMLDNLFPFLFPPNTRQVVLDKDNSIRSRARYLGQGFAMSN